MQWNEMETRIGSESNFRADCNEASYLKEYFQLESETGGWEMAPDRGRARRRLPPPLALRDLKHKFVDHCSFAYGHLATEEEEEEEEEVAEAMTATSAPSDGTHDQHRNPRKGSRKSGSHVTSIDAPPLAPVTPSPSQYSTSIKYRFI